MKRIGPVLLVAVAFLLPPSADRASAGPEPDDVSAEVELVVFHGDGCPHCARMLDFLDELVLRVDGLTVTAHEVWYDAANQQVFIDTLAALGDEPRSVPTVVLGEQVYVGYSDAMARRIERAVASLLAGETPESYAEVDLPFAGSVDVGARSMVGATILIAFVDGFNPCSLWVLSMLLALVVHSGSRSRVFSVGSLFLVVTSLLYGLYMLGAYSTLSIVGRSDWIRAAVALVAATFGVLHLKEHWTTRGPSVTIAASAKPGLFRRMRGLADPNRSLPAALGGTVVLATGVSLLETPCSAGLPLLWTELLADRGVPTSEAALLFGLYLGVFLLDELVVFAAVVVTMRAAKMQERHGRILQLAGGVLMLTLAATMVAAPHLMESLMGVVAVFGAAVAACVAIVAVERWWDRRHGSRASPDRSAAHPAS